MTRKASGPMRMLTGFRGANSPSTSIGKAGSVARRSRSVARNGVFVRVVRWPGAAPSEEQTTAGMAASLQSESLGIVGLVDKLGASGSWGSDPLLYGPCPCGVPGVPSRSRPGSGVPGLGRCAEGAPSTSKESSPEGVAHVPHVALSVCSVRRLRSAN